MFLAAIWALHAVELAAEGLQGGLNPGVHRHDGGRVADGQSLVLAELRWRGRTIVVIMRTTKQVVHSCCGRSWGTGKTWGSGLSWGSLWIEEQTILETLCPLLA